MTTDDIKRVVEKFITYLQLPESPYTLTESDSSDEVEVQIAKGDKLLSAISISNGSVSILYNGGYEENKFFTHTFQSPVYLLYILSIVYYSTVSEEVNIDFNDLLTILIGEEISNWKDLVVGLSKLVMLKCESDMDDVLLEDKKISYQDFSGKIIYGTLEFQIEPHSYTQLIEAIFLIVEYVATIKDTQDSLYTEESENNLIESEQPEESMGGFGGGSLGELSGDEFEGELGGEMETEDTGTPEPVTPEDVENMPDELGQDFSLPEGMDENDMNDLIENDIPEGEE